MRTIMHFIETLCLSYKVFFNPPYKPELLQPDTSKPIREWYKHHVILNIQSECSLQ